MLVGTAAGAVLLFRWSGFLKPPRSVKVIGKVNRATEVAWSLAVMAAQFWSLAVIILPQWSYAFPAVGDVPDLVQWLGLAMWGAGGAVILWATRAMGEAMRPQVLVLEGQRLVRTGPFARVRHPVYTGIILVALGAGSIFLSIPALVVALLIILMASYRARTEEELLSSPEAFGDEYARYMALTGRFLPRLRSRRGRVHRPWLSWRR